MRHDPQVAEDRHELFLGRRVDAGRGLVEQEELGFADERPREQHALALPTGESGDRPAREVADWRRPARARTRSPKTRRAPGGNATHGDDVLHP